VAANAATLSATLAAGISRLAQGAQTVTAALAGYATTDAAGAARIDGTVAAAAEAVAAIPIPSAPSVAVPFPPLDAAAAVASLPADPAVIDDALHAGATETGLQAHGASWDAAAAQLQTAATEMRSLGASLPSSWTGPAADNLTARLGAFSDWLSASSHSARSHAAAARDAASHYRSAVNAHPRAADVRNTQQVLLAAVRRAAAGDPSAVAEALEAEATLTQMRGQSVSAMTQYGQGASDLNSGAGPGDSPPIGDGDPGRPDGLGAAGGEDGLLSEELAADALQAEGDVAGDVPGEFGQGAGQSAQQLMGVVTQMPTQVAQAVGQALNSSGQQLTQVGQQASQAVSQLGQVLSGGSPSGALRGLGGAAGASGVGDFGGGGVGGGVGGGGLGDFGGGGGGLGDFGGGGGLGDFGAGTIPAGLPEQPPPPASSTPSSTPAAATTSAVPRPAVPGMAGMAGGMPMGMMPMGGAGVGGGGDKELPRNTEWFPDEALVTDEPEVSEAVAGQRRRPRPTET
jgi:hypothetical protein